MYLSFEILCFGPRREKTCLRGLRTYKAQSSLHFDTGWSAPVLFTNWKVAHVNLLRATSFNFLANLCNSAGWFKSNFVGNHEDIFSRFVAHYFNLKPDRMFEFSPKINNIIAVLLNTDLSFFENTIDPDNQAYNEAIWSWSTLFWTRIEKIKMNELKSCKLTGYNLGEEYNMYSHIQHDNVLSILPISCYTIHANLSLKSMDLPNIYQCTAALLVNKRSQARFPASQVCRMRF